MLIFSPARIRHASCLHVSHRSWRKIKSFLRLQRSPFTLYAVTRSDETRSVYIPPFRKQLKDEAKQKRAVGNSVAKQDGKSASSRLERWELTVGIEVHAQLNSDHKLFSRATTSLHDDANTHVSGFDLAYPGSQPELQRGTLLPALRAAIALKCNIEPRSTFDRKHYFYQDQPAGYQITQYYEPFAKDGSIALNDHDGIDPADGKHIIIDIKQIQLEQDTAKTLHQPPFTNLLDFNRVSHPLIEIITLPQIHHPQTAAACVRKIQAILQAVSAVTTGMDMGGLRADVNVSVRLRSSTTKSTKGNAYAGITGLGQRTEIKNLSSFKAIEDAIVAERDRQIEVLESGGIIAGETRGWALGATETRKLRGKEGEVDYRYLPDPDLPPLVIDPKLISHISNTLPMLPDQSIHELCDVLALTLQDAKTLVALDDGNRLDYYDEVLDYLGCSVREVDTAALMDENISSGIVARHRKFAKTAANWVLHELGGLLSTSELPFSENRVTAASMASVVEYLLENRITGRSAKQLLAMIFDGEPRDVEAIIREENMELRHLSREEYIILAQELISKHTEMVQQIKTKRHGGKVKWFVGQMMLNGNGTVEANKAEAILKELLGLEIETNR